MNSLLINSAEVVIPCLVCGGNMVQTPFQMECECNICEECLYTWIKTQNEETLYVQTEFFTCPSAECRTPLTKDYLLRHLSPWFADGLNEVLTKKFINRCEGISKCPKQGCDYLGFYKEESCDDPFTCEVCGTEWADKSTTTKDK